MKVRSPLADMSRRRYQREQAGPRKPSAAGVDVALRRLVLALLEVNPTLRERDRLILRAEFLVDEGGR